MKSSDGKFFAWNQQYPCAKKLHIYGSKALIAPLPKEKKEKMAVFNLF